MILATYRCARDVRFLSLSKGATPLALPDCSAQSAGTFFSMSASHTAALPSDGARQSPRGLNDPPCETFGPFGIADRLNCANPKKRRTKTTSHWRIAGRS